MLRPRTCQPDEAGVKGSSEANIRVPESVGTRSSSKNEGKIYPGFAINS